MSRIRYFQGIVALLLLLASACSKKQVVIPIPRQPAAESQPHAVEPPTPVSQSDSTTAPSTSPATSGVGNTGTATSGATTSGATPTGAATTNNTLPPTPYQVDKPAPPPAAPRKASRSTAAPNTSPSVSPSPQSPALTTGPAQAPQLGDIVTPDQRRQYNAAIDQSLSRAQTSLAGIANRELNKDQQRLVEQIRNIMQQAQASRNSDLPGAKSLAARAEVLAKDLAGSFR